jgi:hypothetical protein
VVKTVHDVESVAAEEVLVEGVGNDALVFGIHERVSVLEERVGVSVSEELEIVLEFVRIGSELGAEPVLEGAEADVHCFVSDFHRDSNLGDI